MSLKDLFQVKKVLPPISNEQIVEEVESVQLLDSYVQEKEKIEFAVDYSDPANFSIFGSAKQYYTDTIARIYEQYPYDGSKKEKLDWYNSSSLLDIWFYENAYPRTTGYAKFSPSGWSTLVGSQVSGYGEPTTKEYVVVKGGPNTNSSTSLKDKFEDKSNQNPKSNLYDTTTNRSNNLTLDGNNGVTLEFWLSKDSFITSSTRKEVIFDLWNGAVSSSVSYGRMTLELSGTTGSPFYLTLKSGSSGITSLNLGSGITTSSVANGTWNHYAVTTKNNGSSLDIKLYVNGQLNSETTTGTSVGNVTGSMVANIGALRTAPSGVTGVGLGWGKLSGSLDDFRFWKTERTAREIGRNWWTNIGGGTNTDDANTTLGFYYKFNEGITTNSTIDSIVLDYSGRISNGTWVGYSSASRNTGSAINEYTDKTLSTEEPDPIIYSTHPDVVEILSTYTTIGEVHDTTNSNSIYYSFPNWIVEEDESGDLLNVTQIAASYLDTLYLQIKFLTTIKDQYSNIQIDEKPFPFSKSLLESMGIVAPSLFIDAKLMEEVLSRDEERNFEDKLNEVKNVIYQNIYSNLQSILKSKGTEKSVRNLLHCFGIDEELVKLAVYSNNDTIKVTDNVSNTTTKKKSINLNDPDRFNSTIYQYKDPSNVDSYSYISGSTSTELDYIPYTFEAEVVFPKKLQQDQKGYFTTEFLTSSIFGGHSAVSNPDDYTWLSPDYFGFNVYSVRDEQESKNVKFYLEVPSLSLILSSSLYKEVYENEKWNLAVRIKPDKLENADFVSGSLNTTYTIELYGVNSDGGTTVNEFVLSSSLSNTNGRNFVRAAKRLYFGAERTNFTGSIVKSTDIKLLNLRAWSSYLTNQDVQRHAADSFNYGVSSLGENAYLTQTTFDNISVAKVDTLLLDWQFDEVTSSNSGSGVPNTSDGYFLVNDATSGSLSYSKYNTVFNNLKKYQYVGKGDLFPQNDNTVVDTQYIFTSRLNHFEDIKNSDLVNILSTEEQVLFTRQTRPINYFFSFEKSMYRTISEQMLNMFGTILDFNNLVGDPVNKYRKEYKALGKLRQMFFEKVQNTPDLDKYLDFYKWIDSAVGKFLLQLVPASADTSDGLLNVIESHALERNKHQYKFPTIEFKDPVLQIGLIGINKHLFNWNNGHRPLTNQEDDNCLYWSDKAERTTAPLSSSDAGVNNTRTKVFEAKTQVLNRSYTTPLRLNIEQNKTIKGGTNFETSKNLDYVKIATEPHGPLDSDDTIQPPANYLFAGIENSSSLIKDCDDITNPLEKKKYYFSTVHGRDYNATQTQTYSHVVTSRIALPANFISASIRGGYHDFVTNQFMSGVDIVNIHNDTYGSSNEIPMQGPFTNQWVGGNQSRHISLNTGADSYLTRPEAWKIVLGVLSGSSSEIYDTAVGWIGADYPYPEGNDFEPSYPVVAHKRATYLREETAKRPVNIRNIRSSTGSIDLGNYSRNYQVVQTMGRTTNNRLLLDQVNPITSSELYGVVRTSTASPRTDFTLVERPRTETVVGSRFSAPGDSRTLSRGYLNAYAEELSPYNAMSFRNRQVIGDGRRTADTLTNDIERYNETVSGAVGKSLTALLAKPTAVGGYESGSTTVASLHKVNRNTLYTIDYSGSGTAVTKDYDNGYVTHQIPQNDAGYAWIRAAISGTADDRNLAYFGHILSSYTIPSGTTSTTQSLSMISASSFGSFLDGGNRTLGADILISGSSAFIPTDFVGLNTNIYESASYTTLLATTSDYTEITGGLIDSITNKPSYFNSLIAHRGGAYGYNVFKQIRNSDHPVTRTQKKENYINVMLNKNTTFLEREPSAYYNSSQELYIKNTETDKVFEATYPYENLIQSFENENLFNSLVKQKNVTFYEKAIKMLKDNNKFKFVKLVYKTTIYPKKKYATLADTRYRKYYSFSAWRDNRQDRIRLNQLSDFNYNNKTVHSQSIWPMDGRVNPISGEIPLNYLINTATGTVGAEGVLQNKHTVLYAGLTSSITASVLYSLPHMVLDAGWYLFSRSSFLTASSVSGVPLGEDFRPYNAYLAPYGVEAINVWNSASAAGLLGVTGTYGSGTFRGYSEGLASLLATGGLPTAVPDNSIPWETVNHPSVSYGPYDDSYTKWYEPLRNMVKNYSILPEYVISDDTKIDYLISGKIKDPIANELTLNGASISSSLVSETFNEQYVETNNINNIENLKKDLSSVTKTIKLTLDCDAFLKFNAKPELYPQIRTVQLAEKFINTTLPHMSFVRGNGTKLDYSSPGHQQAIRSVLTPLFAPGILYNTIKSGIAVDFPIYTTSSVNTIDFTSSPTIIASGSGISASYETTGLSGSFDSRIPFEGLLNPENYLNKILDSIINLSKYPSVTTEGSLDYSTIWTGKYDNLSYKLAMNNFLAETIDFFAPDGKLTTLFSRPENEFRFVDPNKKYRALVQIYKSATNNKTTDHVGASPLTASTIYTKPQYTNNAVETITMYSRPSAFGPAVACPSAFISASRGSDFAYAPYTPPYYDGSAWALLTFTPSGSVPYKPTLEEIQANLDIKYLRMEELIDINSIKGFVSDGPVSHVNNNINRSAMQINASLNLFSSINLDEITLNDTDSTKTIPSSKVWSIQTKFETPILNFIPSETGYTPELMEQQLIKTYGMWHQYGVVPGDGKGVYLQITDIPKDYILYGSETSYKSFIVSSSIGNPNLTASLCDIVGFNKEPVKLGQIASQKEIKEAVIAIPYVLEGNQRKFFKLNQKAVNYVNKQYFGVSKDIEAISQNDAIELSTNIRQQIQALEDYVIPPTFDFLNYQEVEPISMYVFEFKHNLTQQDLSHIWQGVQPNIADKVENKKVTITHELNVDELLDINDLTENLQWLVFKVKKKAKTNYFNKRLMSVQEKNKTKEDLLLSLGRKNNKLITSIEEDKELLYSYNWPYDFFSLVELAKIDATLEFDGNEKIITNITQDTEAATTNEIKQFDKPVVNFVDIAPVYSDKVELSIKDAISGKIPKNNAPNNIPRTTTNRDREIDLSIDLLNKNIATFEGSGFGGTGNVFNDAGSSGANTRQTNRRNSQDTTTGPAGPSGRAGINGNNGGTQ
jgi:hypothetical protein